MSEEKERYTSYWFLLLPIFCLFIWLPIIIFSLLNILDYEEPDYF